MLKHFLLLTVFSAAALVGCTTNETKPETTLKPSAKAVVPPVTAKTTPTPTQKTPRQKPRLDILRAAPQNSDALLGRQWASCTADVAAHTTFMDQVFDVVQPFKGQEGKHLGQDQMRDVKTIAFVFQRYSVAAIGESSAKAVFDQQFSKEMQQYMRDWQQLWSGVDTTKNTQAAEKVAAQWTAMYKKQVRQALARSEACVDSIRENEARFLPKVKQDVAQLLKKHKPSSTKF